MSESSAGDSSGLHVIHYVDRKVDTRRCAACGKDTLGYHATDEVLLYSNPPDNFIPCIPPSPQQELDLDH